MRLKLAYTTGEAARICNLSQTTIIRLFDFGMIVGFRVPGSGFRRIPHAELDRFLTEHALPNPLAGTTPPVPAVDDRRQLAREVSTTIVSQWRSIASTTSTVVELLKDSRRGEE